MTQYGRRFACRSAASRYPLSHVPNRIVEKSRSPFRRMSVTGTVSSPNPALRHSISRIARAMFSRLNSLARQTAWQPPSLEAISATHAPAWAARPAEPRRIRSVVSSPRASFHGNTARNFVSRIAFGHFAACAEIPHPRATIIVSIIVMILSSITLSFPAQFRPPMQRDISTAVPRHPTVLLGFFRTEREPVPKCQTKRCLALFSDRLRKEPGTFLPSATPWHPFLAKPGMPRKPLIRSRELPYHVVARANNRERFVLPLDEMWEILTHECYAISTLFGVQIHALVLMINHYHLLLSSPNEDLGKVMQYFAWFVTRNANLKSGRIDHVFGGPYHGSLIDSTAYYRHALRYVYRNPVRAGICRRVEDYRFSTLRGLLGEAVSPFPLWPGPQEYGLWEASENPSALLPWLNQHVPSSHDEAIRKGLRKTQFKIPMSLIKQLV